MGIDIRDGAQLECIHCALCIDACDDIMKKVGRPTGLIAYDTDIAVADRAAGRKPTYKIFPSPYDPVRHPDAHHRIHGRIWVLQQVHVRSERAERPVTAISSACLSGDIRNGYTLKLVNKASGQTPCRG
jgi:polyferredoxin